MMNIESLSQRFAHKILSTHEVLTKVGAFPRVKRVTLCHGTFDVVHPGHLRHLLYAKSKGDILVVSITADRHVSKGDLRPHVPQELRAASLAAYEFVDFVIIDHNSTPIDNIRTLRPDFFVKGYDYNASANPKTQEESREVASYGGQMIFSPGDFVLSSSRLIRSAPPDIRYERLLSLLDRSNLSFDDLRATVKLMAGVKVLVVGDTIIDSYTRCSMIGGQTKTPTISVLFELLQHFVGGAGIVAKHLAAAGAEVSFLTLLGKDKLGEFAINDLRSAGVHVDAMIDESRPTTDKNAIVVDQYRLLKVDTLDNRPIDEVTVKRFTHSISAASADVFVFSDFRHGLFNRVSIPALTSAVPAGAFRVADSQVASRWGNITEFVGFDLVTPNERESRFALGDQDSNIRSLAASIYAQAKCKVLIMKLGERGSMTYTSSDATNLSGYFLLDSFASSVIDAVGAGDALLAYATLALKISGSPEQASILGSFAAACECEVDGNVPITADTVLARIDAIEKAASYLS